MGVSRYNSTSAQRGTAASPQLSRNRIIPNFVDMLKMQNHTVVYSDSQPTKELDCDDRFSLFNTSLWFGSLLHSMFVGPPNFSHDTNLPSPWSPSA